MAALFEVRRVKNPAGKVVRYSRRRARSICWFMITKAEFDRLITSGEAVQVADFQESGRGTTITL